MNRGWLLALALFPAMGHAVICQTVGEDGVVSFTNVPGEECPRGSALPQYAPSAPPQAERAQQVDTGISARQVKFPGYREIAIASPQDDGVVRNNTGSVTVQLALDPEMLAAHFVTVYLDGKAVKGRFGSSQVELTGVDPGTHKLRAKVFDASGRTLIGTETISFTLLRTQPIQVHQLAPNPNERGKYIISGQFLGGPVALPEAAGAEVTIRFPGSDKDYVGAVDEFLNWEVEVGSEPAVEKRFDVEVKVMDLEFKKTQDINPTISRPTYTPPPSKGYTPPSGTADYRSRGGSISTTPGRTNPAFAPKYTP